MKRSRRLVSGVGLLALVSLTAPAMPAEAPKPVPLPPLAADGPAIEPPRAAPTAEQLFALLAPAGCSPVGIPERPDGSTGEGSQASALPPASPAYLQLATSSGPPPRRDCDEAAERGRLIADTAGGRLFLCADAGWVALAP